MMEGATPAPLGDVVIIGAGVSGLACARTMLKWGCRSLVVLEHGADLGGIWRTTTYADLALHLKSFSYSFYDFPLQCSAERASREDIQAYLERYASTFDLKRHIKFHHEVQQVVYHGEGHASKPCCEVLARGPDGEHLRLPADFVVCAVGFSNAGRPASPALAGLEDFGGPVVHSSCFGEQLMDQVVAERKRVVVLGAGKSALDILAAFKRRGHDSMSWLFSKSMWFFAWDHMYGSSTLTWILRTVLLGIWLQVRIGLGECWLERGLQSLVRAAGVLVNAAEPSCREGLERCRFAVARREELEAVSTVPRVRGRAERLVRGGVELGDGRVLPADVLVCATGFRRGGSLPALLLADGRGGLEELALATEDGPSLYRAMIPAACPRVAMFAGENLTSQTPMASSLQAEWLVRFYASGSHLRAHELHAAVARDRRVLKRYSWLQSSVEGNLSGGNPYMDVVLPAVLHYEGQLLGDLGLPPLPLDGSRSPASFAKYCGEVRRCLGSSSAEAS